ncbi:MAG TPA: hypothetical protein VFG54_04590 [Prolixibacteraceae bacterium]|nr:hypothetical protein [Prolixibacteraceae bacterium]
MNKKITNSNGSIGNVVEAKAKAKAEAGESDQWSVFSVQSVSQSVLSATTGQQSINSSVHQFFKFLLSPQVFRMIHSNTKVIFCWKLKAFQAIILIFRLIEVTFVFIIK